MVVFFDLQKAFCGMYRGVWVQRTWNSLVGALGTRTEALQGVWRWCWYYARFHIPSSRTWYRPIWIVFMGRLLGSNPWGEADPLFRSMDRTLSISFWKVFPFFCGMDWKLFLVDAATVRFRSLQGSGFVPADLGGGFGVPSSPVSVSSIPIQFFQVSPRV